MINIVISPMASCMDLSPRYRWLHLVFHASWLKPHIKPAPNTEPSVVLGDDDVESEYEVE